MLLRSKESMIPSDSPDSPRHQVNYSDIRFSHRIVTQHVALQQADGNHPPFRCPVQAWQSTLHAKPSHREECEAEQLGSYAHC
jgi:hypothetical protein